nr:hypothetical protein [Tanacetum cinerariifolium]
MISEEFSEIRLSDSLLRVNVDTDTATRLSICNLKESTVVLQFTCEMALRDEFGVWMMDNGDPKSFEKGYTIKSNNILDTPIIDVLAFRKNGESVVTMTKLGVETFEYQLFVYERNSRHVNHIGISAKQYSFFVSSYKERLLLLDH